MTIKKRAILLAAILLGLVMTQTAVTAWRDYTRMQNDAAVEKLVAALRNHMVGDMMHDALRGDAQRALLAVMKGDAATINAARTDLDDHVTTLDEALKKISESGIDADAQKALDSTLPVVKLYVEGGGDAAALKTACRTRRMVCFAFLRAMAVSSNKGLPASFHSFGLIRLPTLG